jgi:hypothetical protein
MLATVNRGITMQARHQEIQDDPGDAGRLCDFCGDRVGTVRRVALDSEYDRLQKVHHEQYSCSTCFEAKEQRRLGLGRR